MPLLRDTAHALAPRHSTSNGIPTANPELTAPDYMPVQTQVTQTKPTQMTEARAPIPEAVKLIQLDNVLALPFRNQKKKKKPSICPCITEEDVRNDVTKFSTNQLVNIPRGPARVDMYDR